jgi:hypothetical protein
MGGPLEDGEGEPSGLGNVTSEESPDKGLPHHIRRSKAVYASPWCFLLSYEFSSFELNFKAISLMLHGKCVADGGLP